MHVVATAGHVDHGKSTLVHRLTGTDPDRWAEEKARGMTIDLGFGVAALPSGRRVAFVDVPGHVRFIKNMLAGVGAVDACLFVVAATEVVVGAWVEVVAPAGQLPTLTAMAYSGSVTSITTDRSSVASVILPTRPAPFVTVIPTRMPLDLPRFNSKVWEKFDGD